MNLKKHLPKNANELNIVFLTKLIKQYFIEKENAAKSEKPRKILDKQITLKKLISKYNLDLPNNYIFFNPNGKNVKDFNKELSNYKKIYNKLFETASEELNEKPENINIKYNNDTIYFLTYRNETAQEKHKRIIINCTKQTYGLLYKMYSIEDAKNIIDNMHNYLIRKRKLDKLINLQNKS